MATILIVDDDPQVRCLLDTFLGAQFGHEVVFAVDGQQATERFSRFDPDLVITDLVMPKVSGVQLIKHLSCTYPGAKIIAISGKGPEGLAEARQAGAFAALPKPLDRDQLARVVGEAIGPEPDPWGPAR